MAARRRSPARRLGATLCLQRRKQLIVAAREMSTSHRGAARSGNMAFSIVCQETCSLGLLYLDIGERMLRRRTRTHVRFCLPLEK